MSERSWLTPTLNWLVAFLPLAAGLEIAHSWCQATWATPTLIFVCSAIAIVPAAGWMGHATEELAARLGEAWGGLLNATFGNAAELIIACMALAAAAANPERAPAMLDLVKASLTGSIIGNVLLVLGVALLTGGLKHQVQRFNAAGTRVNATLLALAAGAMVMPALLYHFTHELRGPVQELSLEFALLLLLCYGLSLVFTLHTHKHLYVSAPSSDEAQGVAPGEHTAGHAAPPVWMSLGKLLGATVVVGFLAEFMVGSVEGASQAIGLTELFVGVIVVAIVGNAAEHSTAVLMAWKNRMDLSLGIAIGSSIQIALFVAPALVLAGYAFGVRMDLVFTVPEIVAVLLTVWILAQIAGDGESNWLEGVLLLLVYAMLAMLFFHLPASASHPQAG
jgi:Ca2+:H+ antiporter